MQPCETPNLIDWDLFQRRFAPQTNKVLLKRALRINFDREPDTTIIWSGRWNYKHAIRLCDEYSGTKYVTLELIVRQQDKELWDLLEIKSGEEPDSVIEIWVFLSRRFAETATGNIRTLTIGTNIPDEISHLEYDEIVKIMDDRPLKKSSDVFFKDRIAGRIEMTTILGVASDDPTMMFTYDFIERTDHLDPLDLQLSSLPWETQYRNTCIDLLDVIGGVIGTNKLNLISHRVRWFEASFWNDAFFVQIERRDDSEEKVRLFGVMPKDKKNFYIMSGKIKDIYDINRKVRICLTSESVSTYLLLSSLFAMGPMGIVPFLGVIPWVSDTPSGKSLLENMVAPRVPPKIYGQKTSGSWQIEGCMRMFHDGRDSGPLLTHASVHEDGKILIDHWKAIADEHKPKNLDKDGWMK